MVPKTLGQTRPKTSVLDFAPEEIQRFLHDKLTRHGVEEAYLFGSCAHGRATAWSDIDLVVIARTDLPFLERPRQFDDLFELGIALDLLVYPPEEFQRLRENPAGFWKSFEERHLRIV